MRLLLLTTALTLVSTGALAGGDWVSLIFCNSRMIRHSAERRRDVRRPRLSRLPTSRRQFKRCRLRLPTINHLSRSRRLRLPTINHLSRPRRPEAPATRSTRSIQAPEGKRGFVIPPTVSFDSTPTPAMRPTAPLTPPPPPAARRAHSASAATEPYAPTRRRGQYRCATSPFAKPKEEPLDWVTIFWAIVSVPFLIIIGLFSAVKRFDRFRATPPFLSMFVGWMAVNSASRRAEKVRAKQERKQEEAYRTSAPLPPRGPLVQG